MSDAVGEVFVKATRDCQCDSCGMKIYAGNYYFRQLNQDASAAYDYRAHAHCSEASSILAHGLGAVAEDGGFLNVSEFDSYHKEYIRLVRPDLAAKLWPLPVSQPLERSMTSARSREGVVRPGGGLRSPSERRAEPIEPFGPLAHDLLATDREVESK